MGGDRCCCCIDWAVLGGSRVRAVSGGYWLAVLMLSEVVTVGDLVLVVLLLLLLLPKCGRYADSPLATVWWSVLKKDDGMTECAGDVIAAL